MRLLSCEYFKQRQLQNDSYSNRTNMSFLFKAFKVKPLAVLGYV